MNGVRIAALALVVSQTAWAQDATDEQPQYARVIAEEAQPRCFASERSPRYGDHLTEGQVVIVGEQVGDHWQIWLPLGVTGYIHKRFAAEQDGGKIIATASKVSFRYRPKTSEAPAAVMDKGAETFLFGEEGEWWKVSNPELHGYLPTGDLQLIDEVSEADMANHAEFDKARRADWAKALEHRAVAVAAAAELAAQTSELEAITTELRVVASQPLERQAYGALKSRAAALVQQTEEGSDLHGRAINVERAIAKQELVAEALTAVAVEAPTRDVSKQVLPPVDVDALQRFDAVGWMHTESIDGTDETRYILMKGGRMIVAVTCTSERYDLALFVGSEIGITGPDHRSAADRARVIDVAKIEVLKPAN